MKLKPVLVFLLILDLAFAFSGLSHAQSQTQYSLNLEEVTWNHTTISVLIVPQDSMPWWNPAYLNATLRAMGEWNQAILGFASNYSGFSYLSRITMVPTLAQTQESGFDVSITWTKTPQSASVDEIGYTETVYNTRNIIVKCTISLSAEESHGYVLNEVDMQNVALHEIGHSLGLGHSSYAGDIMYPAYTPDQQVKKLSSLDAFGVSTVFHWTQETPQTSAYPPQMSTVTLPSNIAYSYLPASIDNLPPITSPPAQTPDQTALTHVRDMLTNILQYVLHPEIFVALSVSIAMLIISEIIIANNKKRKETIDLPARITDMSFTNN